jgi:ankyrin repeat protein
MVCLTQKHGQKGYVLLCDAVENKHTEVAKLLLTNGSKVNSENKKLNDNPLHFAAINGDRDCSDASR